MTTTVFNPGVTLVRRYWLGLVGLRYGICTPAGVDLGVAHGETVGSASPCHLSPLARACRRGPEEDETGRSPLTHGFTVGYPHVSRYRGNGTLADHGGGHRIRPAMLAFPLALFLALALALPARADWLTDAGRSPIKTFTGAAASAKQEDQTERRGKVTVRRLKPKCYSDWNNDPTALPYYFYQLGLRTQGRFPCYMDNRGLDLASDEIFDYPIIYFTSHYPFTFSDEEIENLRKYLALGGTLWLDDCTGSGPFMDSVPANLQRLVPGEESHLMLLSDPRFADIFNLVYKLRGYPKLKENFMKPFQATLCHGRPAILFCPNDYGCYWEVSSPPTALNPLGNPAHDNATPFAQNAREEVYQFSINWLFYSLTH